MRAPTIPEAHLVAVILSTVLAWSWYGFAIGRYPAAAAAAPFVFVPFGVWLWWAWLGLRLQRRVAAMYADRLKQAGAARTATTPREEQTK